MGFSPISYKFIAAAALTASKTLIYRMTPTRPSDGGIRDKAQQSDEVGASGISVHPGNLEGKFFETDITLSKKGSEELKIAEAVCSVSRPINCVKTTIPGLAGTIKEYVAPGDYDLTIVVGLVAVNEQTGVLMDKYPSDGVKKLNEILGTPEALTVDSAFLALFGINRVVITEYKIEQMTYSNRQVVTIKALSDEDYTIEYNEY